MSSVGSVTAQIGRRINYFRCLADISGYTVAQGTDAWSAPALIASTIASSGAILQDMGETAKYNGAILRKVRLIDSVTEATGNLNSVVFFIVVPGGEYPVAGVATGVSLAVTPVARLG